MAQIIWVCISVLEEVVIEYYISIHIMQNIAVGNMKLRLWAYFGTPITNWEIGDSEQELQELDKKNVHRSGEFEKDSSRLKILPKQVIKNYPQWDAWLNKAIDA